MSGPWLRAAAVATLLGGCPAIDTSVGAWRPQVDAGAAPDAGRASAPALYIEAEDGELSGGFTVASDPRASGERFIAPPDGQRADDAPGDARARYQFTLTRAGEYLVWGRIHAPAPTNNRFWFQLDGGAFVKWRISTGDIWYWDDLHDNISYGTPLRFQLAAGVHELVIANCVDGVGLDRLYITARGDMPAGNDTPCRPPHSIEVSGECLPSCGSLDGRLCGPSNCAGKPLLPAYDCDVCCMGD
jgi:hypothetical protein